MTRFPPFALFLAGSVGLFLIVAAPPARANDSPQTLAAQQKIIDSLKARLDKLEAARPSGERRGGLRKTKPAPHKPRPPLAMDGRALPPLSKAAGSIASLGPRGAALKSRLDSQKSQRTARQKPAAVQVQDLKFEVHQVEALRKDLMTLLGIVKQLAANQEQLGTSVTGLWAQSEAAMGQIQLVAGGFGEALNTVDANLAVLAKADADRQADVKNLHDVLAADEGKLHKVKKDLNDAWQELQWETHNIVEITMALNCNGFDWLPGRMTGNAAGWNWDTCN